MNQIDWSESPTWATNHGYAGPYDMPVWFDDQRYQYVKNGQIYNFGTNGNRHKRDIKNITGRTSKTLPAWNGEGLPPVGTRLRDEALRSLQYKPATGQLIWKENKQSRFIGREAGSVNHHGYRRMHVLNTRIDAHRLVWLMHYGVLPDGEIDHINGNKLDNRVENLRIADQQRNQQNVGVRTDSRLGVKGVRLRPSGKYQARVKLTDGSRMVKSFESLDSAVAWLSSVRKESHGEFARDSSEQIAAEERDKAVHEILSHMRGVDRDKVEMAMSIYDAGYRKQVQP